MTDPYQRDLEKAAELLERWQRATKAHTDALQAPDTARIRHGLKASLPDLPGHMAAITTTGDDLEDVEEAMRAWKLPRQKGRKSPSPLPTGKPRT